MIKHLLIRNFAVIEETEIEFEDGLNIITGETGAGKSIVIEAISLALGARADSSFVRTGKDRALIQLAADLDGEEVILTREISANGKNLCRSNGRLVTLAELAETAGKIADFHGQYDNQKLLDPVNHLRLVDRYSSVQIDPIKAAFAAAYQEYKEARLSLDRILKTEQENLRKKDFFRFELDEISNAHLSLGEDEELSERNTLLQNSEKIFAGIGTAFGLLDENEQNVLSSLGSARQALEEIRGFSKDLAEAADTLDDAYYRLQDVTGQLAAVREESTFSPSELDSAIERLDLIEKIKKKYGPTIEDVLTREAELTEALDQIENIDMIKEKQMQVTQKKLADLKAQAALLTEARKLSADRLAAAIETELHDLNFNHAVLQIQISPAPAIGADGADQAEILLSTNPGEPVKPLIRVASGGEISRIMLAIRNITGTLDLVPTMIFDEIDSGISGITASVVGRKLKQIAEDHQILCITHLPQIAATGNANYRIHKESDLEKTFTHVDALSPEETVQEIARLLGGDVITETTLASARELISQSR